jgi:hypothetical protein
MEDVYMLAVLLAAMLAEDNARFALLSDAHVHFS